MVSHGHCRNSVTASTHQSSFVCLDTQPSQKKKRLIKRYLHIAIMSWHKTLGESVVKEWDYWNRNGELKELLMCR